MTFRLEGRVAIITGGARGIGAETTRVFREAGAKVTTWDVGDPADMKVDVTDADAVRTAVADVVAKHGRIDVLVNNAGILRDAQLIKLRDGAVTGGMSAADFDAVLDVNAKGMFICTQAVAPIMIKQGSGRILNASSVVGLYGSFGQTNYVASKAAVIGMTKVWARELGPRGITVNAVAPGSSGRRWSARCRKGSSRRWSSTHRFVASASRGMSRMPISISRPTRPPS